MILFSVFKIAYFFKPTYVSSPSVKTCKPEKDKCTGF